MDDIFDIFLEKQTIFCLIELVRNKVLTAEEVHDVCLYKMRELMSWNMEINNGPPLWMNTVKDLLELKIVCPNDVRNILMQQTVDSIIYDVVES